MSLKPEQIAHINIVNWFYYKFPEYEKDLYHFANERFIDVKNNPGLWQHAKTLSKMGVKRGILDFFIAIPMNGKAGLWLELKVGKGKLSPEQIEFIERNISRGYEAIAVWGEEAAKAVIVTYLKKEI